jgi:ADP-heptose:LPS heptosyltransferase
VAYGLPDGPRWTADEHEVARWCRLLDESGMPADPRDLLLEVPDVEPPVRGAVLVHPGAAQASRRWPVERWGRVAAGLAAAGHDVRVTGGPGERELARAVARTAGLAEEQVLAGRTGLLELAALVAAARLLVSPDTGVAHLATAFGTPSVVLFGPTPPALWGPPADRPQHRALWAGRTGDNFAGEPDAGLLALTVDQVLAAALS